MSERARDAGSIVKTGLAFALGIETSLKEKWERLKERIRRLETLKGDDVIYSFIHSFIYAFSGKTRDRWKRDDDARRIDFVAKSKNARA